MPKERPILNNIVSEKTLEIETFQNAILRPIIKMQHELILALFQNYVTKRKIQFATIDDQKKRDIIQNIFEKDINFKHVVLGIFIGHFSSEEFEVYVKRSSEFHKRIIQITIQRILDAYLKMIKPLPK
jgi:predicted histidine transporter YuiF (NhaC family)